MLPTHLLVLLHTLLGIIDCVIWIFTLAAEPTKVTPTTPTSFLRLVSCYSFLLTQMKSKEMKMYWSPFIHSSVVKSEVINTHSTHYSLPSLANSWSGNSINGKWNEIVKWVNLYLPILLVVGMFDFFLTPISMMQTCTTMP